MKYNETSTTVVPIFSGFVIPLSSFLLVLLIFSGIYHWCHGFVPFLSPAHPFFHPFPRQIQSYLAILVHRLDVSAGLLHQKL